MAYFTTTLQAAGRPWRFQWVNSVIYTDPFLLGKWTKAAANTEWIEHPVCVSQHKPWIENPYAVLFILGELGQVGEVVGDAFPPEVPGRIY